MKVQTLQSREDDSVNFVFTGEFPGFFEARYVRRDPRKMAVYLSSQTGCRQACRMCHLTATGQTNDFNATLDIYLAQAREVFAWYDQHVSDKAQMVHFNFMARGEALANPHFLEEGQELLCLLGQEATQRGLQARFLVSTIMPKVFDGKSLGKHFPFCGPEIYYSIYSTREDFRKKWLPNALPVDQALAALKEYHDDTKKVVRLHWAFIAGENDDADGIALMCHRVRQSGLPVEIRIVRYNPYSEKHGEEPEKDIIDKNVALIRELLPFSHVKIITRVGFDVKASCGMFVGPDFS